MAETQSLFYTTSLHFVGADGRGLSQAGGSVVTVCSVPIMTICMCIPCLSRTLFLINNAAVAVCFFYLIDVSSKLFVSRPTIFSFLATNSPLHPAAGKRECEEGVREWCMVWSGFNWNPTLGSTIPKP